MKANEAPEKIYYAPYGDIIKNNDNWVVDYRFYPEQGYYITNKKKNEYR